MNVKETANANAEETADGIGTETGTETGTADVNARDVLVNPHARFRHRLPDHQDRLLMTADVISKRVTS